MKKLLFLMTLGAVALSACTSTDEIDDGIMSNAIRFESNLGKPARADVAISGDLTIQNLDKFMVYGFYTKEDQTATPIQVFGGDAVTKDPTGSWGYKGTRYWVPDATYNFFAYSCADVALDNSYGTVGMDLNATGASRQLTISNFRSDAFHQHDLIYAQAKDIKALPISADKPTPNPNVSFKFEHILTKIDAVFTSEFSSDYDIVIRDVKIVNFRNVGNFSKAAGEWTGVERVKDKQTNIEMQLRFTEENGGEGVAVANAAQDEKHKPKTRPNYVIPFAYQTTDVQLNFTILVYKGQDRSAESLVLSRDFEGHWRPNWEMGKYYTYNVNLTGTAANLQPIVFEVAQDMNGFSVGSSTATDLTFSAN